MGLVYCGIYNTDLLAAFTAVVIGWSKYRLGKPHLQCIVAQDYWGFPPFFKGCWHIPVKLPWIFPGAPLVSNGPPRNIQGNLTGMLTVPLYSPDSRQMPAMKALQRDCEIVFVFLFPMVECVGICQRGGVALLYVNKTFPHGWLIGSMVVGLVPRKYCLCGMMMQFDAKLDQFQTFLMSWLLGSPAGDRFTKKVSSLWKWANFSNFITFCKLAHLFGELKVFH